MSKKIISVICGLITVSMLLALVSCKKTNTQIEGTESDVVENTQSQVETDANGFEVDGIGDDVYYDGRTVGVFGWSGGGEMDFDSQSGTAISNAVYKRNVSVEDRLGVRLRFNTSLNGSNAKRDEYIASVETILAGSTDYDLISTYSMSAASFAIDGFLVDLGQKSQLQLVGKPWWSQDIVENAMINGKVFFMSGPISPKLLYESMAILVNLDMIDYYLLEDPRYLVQDYEWTMDKMFELSRNVGEDVSGDGKDESDIYGVIFMETLVDGFIASNGIRYLDGAINSSTGKETLQIDAHFDNGLKVIDLVDRINTVAKGSSGWVTNSANVFIGGNALFMTGTFDIIQRNKDKMNFNYGYLPYPMADKHQGEYYSTAGFPYSMWCITKASLDTDCAAYVMECLASESYRIVQPAVYNDIKFQYSNDAINSEMFDLIVGSMTYDYGRLFHNNFEYANSPVYTFRSAITRGYSYTTNITTNRDHINSILDKLNELFA